MEEPAVDFAALRTAYLDAPDGASRQAALDQLVGRIQPYVRRLAGSLLRSRQRFDSEDIQQSVCLRLVRNLEERRIELRTEAEFLGLLRTMVRNLVMDRQGARRASTSINEASADESTDLAGRLVDRNMSTPSEFVGERELQAVVWGELASCLQPDELYLVRSHLAQGVRQKELAEELGLSEDAVRMRLQRARRKIRDRLGEDCDWLFE